MWHYQGIMDKNATSFYNDWAFQEYVQGHFNQCPIVTFACADNKYPWLAMNIYADGHSDLFGAR